MPQTEKKTLADLAAEIASISNRLAQIEHLGTVRADAKPVTLIVHHETRRQLIAEAQALGLRDADALAQIVLSAFLDMMREDKTICFPLILQQVPEL